MSVIYSIVDVTGKKSKYHGDRAIIWNETASQYKLRSIYETPTAERFMYDRNNIMRGAQGKYKTYSISKNSVSFTGKKKKIDVNDYMDETTELIDHNTGLTKKQIEKKYRNQ